MSGVAITVLFDLVSIRFLTTPLSRCHAESETPEVSLESMSEKHEERGAGQPAAMPGDSGGRRGLLRDGEVEKLRNDSQTSCLQ